MQLLTRIKNIEGIYQEINMSILLEEILKWSRVIPKWQSDAIARLLVKQTLAAEDVHDLFALVKSGRGIPDPQKREAKPLTAAQIPTPANDSMHVELYAIKNLQHVNAIASNQRLSFEPTGLNIIYGDNGSGKSGYSRVLKKACRARDQEEEICPNINLPANEAGNAKAVFEISVNGTKCDVSWINDKRASPRKLSSLGIFDSHCARAYIDNEGDFCYVPYGFDVLERLAKVCQQIKSFIDEEYKQSNVDLTAFNSLKDKGETAVGKLINTLSAKTTVAQIEKLTTLTFQDVLRHADLQNVLKENDPKEKAKLLRTRARIIAIIASNAKIKGELVDRAAADIKSLADKYRVAKNAAAIANTGFKDENLLPGTGGDAWRKLFEAARQFAHESHQGKTFPKLGVDAPCPLCQQPLVEGHERLLLFESFIQQEVEQTSQECHKALYEKYNSFVEKDLNLNFDDGTFGEIENIDKQLATDIREFEKLLNARQKLIKEAVISHKWNGIDVMLNNPTARIQKIADNLNDEVNALENVSDEKARVTMQQQFDELDARLRLIDYKKAVVVTVEKLNHQEKLRNCLSDVNTYAISLKISELTKKNISKKLTNTLNKEFESLGVNNLKILLNSRAVSGKAMHKLKLETPQNIIPRNIFSEGEQRAIAIGSFLAEVNLSGSRGGIIFDDPVSSLDHNRRELVAKRLVAEAAKRQVIVFTHDIYFLNLLIEKAKWAGVPTSTKMLVKNSEGFGVAESDLPFEGKNTRERIGALKAKHQEIEKIFKNGDEQKCREQTGKAYSNLRIAWERAVEEVLLQQVILRFRRGVETQRLAGVVVEEGDYPKIDCCMAKCSNYAHDNASIAGIVAMPKPDELLADIMELEKWREEVNKRSKRLLKNRKK